MIKKFNRKALNAMTKMKVIKDVEEQRRKIYRKDFILTMAIFARKIGKLEPFKNQYFKEVTKMRNQCM